MPAYVAPTIDDVSVVPPALSSLSVDDRLWLEQNFSIVRQALVLGVTGTFVTADPKTVTVTRGIITGIV